MDLGEFGFSSEEIRKVKEIKKRPEAERFPFGRKNLYEVSRNEKLCPKCEEFVLVGYKCFCGYYYRAGSANF